MSLPDPVRPEPGPEADIDEIQTDIAQTRKELGETVEALTAKMDVKQRTKDKAIDDGRAKVTVPVVAVVVVGAAALVWFLRRRR